jgi:hypothetical protein
MYTCFKNTKTYACLINPGRLVHVAQGLRWFPTEVIKRRPTRWVIGIEELEREWVK